MSSDDTTAATGHLDERAKPTDHSDVASIRPAAAEETDAKDSDHDIKNFFNQAFIDKMKRIPRINLKLEGVVYGSFETREEVIEASIVPVLSVTSLRLPPPPQDLAQATEQLEVIQRQMLHMVTAFGWKEMHAPATALEGALRLLKIGENLIEQYNALVQSLRGHRETHAAVYAKHDEEEMSLSTSIVSLQDLCTSLGQGDTSAETASKKLQPMFQLLQNSIVRLNARDELAVAQELKHLLDKAAALKASVHSTIADFSTGQDIRRASDWLKVSNSPKGIVGIPADRPSPQQLAEEWPVRFWAPDALKQMITRLAMIAITFGWTTDRP